MGDSRCQEGRLFERGDLVSLKADPSVTGAVIEVIAGDPEDRYGVFVDGERRTYYASQLTSAEKSAEPRSVLPLPKFHARLSALQIQHPGTSTLYSLNAARVDFVPYQFRPVLKFIRSERPRLLIADGVGVGKTIEAGLIFRELQARRELNSVLIVCPKALVTDKKWRMEMKRFDESFTQIDGSTLRYCIEETDLDGVWPQQHAKTIVPYSLLDEARLEGSGSGRRKRKRLGLKDLEPPPHFDLVIVDEAHHIRNTDTYSHKAVKFFCENSEAVLFLTATPIQLGSQDLFVLLNVLRPDLIVDEESFRYMAEPNKHINRAIQLARGAESGWEEKALEALESAGRTEWGQSILSKSPDYQDVQTTLSESPLAQETRVRLIGELKELHTFSNLINRTRRRDIEEFTTRKPETIRVPLTDGQKQVHDRILEVQRKILGRLHSDIPIGFLMTTIQRQAASCLCGLAPLLEDILTRRIDELIEQEAGDAYDISDLSFVEDIQSDIEMVLAEAERLEGPDRKLQALRRIVAEKQDMPNNRIMLFSTFRHTLSYLGDHLRNDGHRLAVMHGGTAEEERVRIRDRFRLPREDPDALDVVLFSEVACEGLDFQFCDCMVNYDLPWNPMRVEQRIGRIDRHGQQSETVAIYNMITPGTVDAEIYDRCLRRIGVFERALGGNESILGEISQEIHSIAENLELTEEERSARLQQLADNEIRDIQEQERLEERQRDLFGIRLPQEQVQQEIEGASSYWLSPGAIENLVRNYVTSVSDTDAQHILGKGALKTLRASQELRNNLRDDFDELDGRQSAMWRDWERFLRQGRPHLSITFEAGCARENRDAMFIMPVHPLAVQAAEAFDVTDRLCTAFEVKESSIEPGEYPFAIYEWRYHGVREELELHPICQNPDLNDDFLSLLEKGQSMSLGPNDLPGESEFERIDQEHYRRWKQAREDHRRETRAHVEQKKESLSKSCAARIALCQDQLAHGTDENIRRMKKKEIQNVRQERQQGMDKLARAEEKADITARPVAFGLIRVSP